MQIRNEIESSKKKVSDHHCCEKKVFDQLSLIFVKPLFAVITAFKGQDMDKTNSLHKFDGILLQISLMVRRSSSISVDLILSRFLFKTFQTFSIGLTSRLFAGYFIVFIVDSPFRLTKLLTC